MDEQLICPLCEQQYSESINKPRLIPICGHTYCQKCIKKIITEKKGCYKLVCPQDGEMITIKDNNINNFPVNKALVKLMEMQVTEKEKEKQIQLARQRQRQRQLKFENVVQDCQVSKIVKSGDEQQQDEDTRDLVASIISPNNTKSQDAIKLQNKDQDKDKDKDKDQEIEHHNSNNNQNQNKKKQVEVCLLHQKPLQVVCIIDLKKICASCAIFGEHRGHQFKSIEEIEKQRVSYYHSILNIMQKKQQISQSIQSPKTQLQLTQLLHKKSQTLKSIIIQKYQKLIQQIQNKQKQTIKTLQQILLKSEHKIKGLMKIDDKIIDKYDKWEEKSYREIQILEGEDFQKKLELLYFGGGDGEGGDVVEEGDRIIGEMKKQEDNLMMEVEGALESVGVQFNMDIFNYLDGFVEIFDQTKRKKSKGRNNSTKPQQPSTQKPQSSYQNPPKQPPHKKSPLQNTPKQSPISISASYSVSPSIQKPILQKQSPNQIHNSNIYPPKYINPQATVTQSYRSQIINIDHHHEESLLEMLEDIEVKKIEVEEQKNQAISFQPMLKKQQLAPIFSMKNTPEKPEQLSLNLPITQKSLETTKPHQPTTIQKTKSPPLTERSKKDNSFSAQKQALTAQGKKKILTKLKLPQKFSQVLEGLLNDQLETVDFTNAQLGDSVILQICQYLQGSKAKTVKLIRNKINDETIQKILPYMGGVITLNLSQNLLTERVLDIIYNAKDELHSVKSIILSQNKIMQRKAKLKIDKLRALQITISL